MQPPQVTPRVINAKTTPATAVDLGEAAAAKAAPAQTGAERGDKDDH